MPGECYHLYPRCVYDAFADYQQPELLRTPLQSLCLQIKSLGLGSISEFLSRALQPPEALSVMIYYCFFFNWFPIKSWMSLWFPGPECCWVSKTYWCSWWQRKFNSFRCVSTGNTFSIILNIWVLKFWYELIYVLYAGKNLSMLPVEPKLGKMLILGAIFNCLDPIMTVVAGLSVRDPFLMPFDKKDVRL